jgi:hypothetical protein
MASTGAVLYVRPRITAGVSAGRSTGAVLYVPMRAVAGVYQTSVVDSADRRFADAWLPSAGNPLAWVMVGGQRLPVYIDVQSWYRFLVTVAEVKLGGFGGNTVPDVVAAVENTQAESVINAQRVAAVVVQAAANAEALDVTRQVVQNNALTGSDQIPRVQMAAGENFP